MSQKRIDEDRAICKNEYQVDDAEDAYVCAKCGDDIHVNPELDWSNGDDWCYSCWQKFGKTARARWPEALGEIEGLRIRAKTADLMATENVELRLGLAEQRREVERLRSLTRNGRRCDECTEAHDAVRALQVAVEALTYCEPALPVLATILEKLDLGSQAKANDMHNAIENALSQIKEIVNEKT